MKKSYLKKTWFKNILFFAFVIFFYSGFNAQCVPSGMATWENNTYINNFTFSTINNSSTFSATRYSDYTSTQSVNVIAGDSYSFSITSTKHNWANIEAAIWIDYDGTGNYIRVWYSGGHDNTGNLTTYTHSGNFQIDPLAVTSSAVMRVAAAYQSSDNGILPTNPCIFQGRSEVEDYTLNITALAVLDPIAIDDNLNVLVNSTAGVANQINVSTNDNIGTSDGSDGDDYSINTLPANGTVTETATDGFFEYVPTPGYVGPDSFTYNICDAGGDCASATVNVAVGFGQCVPTSTSTASSRNLYITNFNLPGETYTLNNNSLDNGGYADFTSSLPAVDFFRNTTYTATLTGGSNPNWVKGQVRWVVYIDFNQNGDFSDAGEELYLSGGNENSDSATPQNINIPNTALSGLTVMRVGVRFQSDPEPCDNNTTRAAEYEDYLVEIKDLDTPLSVDDDLTVAVDSGSGVANQIDVSLNDSPGTDGIATTPNGYTLTSASPTTNGGTITEVSEGVFEYIPASGYIGGDSFTYQICDTTPDCETATVYVNVSLGHCIPTSSSTATSNQNLYIDNVNFSGEAGTSVNNTSGDNGGYGDFTTSQPTVIFYKGEDYTIDLTAFRQHNWMDIGWTIYIDLNGNGLFTELADRIYSTGGTEGFPLVPQTITIPTASANGKTVLRVGTRTWFSSDEPCGNTAIPVSSEEFEDYLIDIQINPSSPAEMDITSNDNSVEVGTTTNLFNNTDFGVYDIYTVIPLTKTFTITNNGSAVLNLTGAPIVEFLAGSSADFSISAQPGATTLAPSASTTFEISFAPTAPTIGTRTATVSIANNDADENPYTFVIEGYGDQTFADTDGDGIPNNVDIDDDNDGLLDEFEQTSCFTNPTSTTTDVIFLFEDFEAGTSRGTIDGVDYCYEDGFGLCGSIDLGDGDYTVYYQAANGDTTNDTPNGEVASWADVYWYPGLDHTPGDINGRMAMFNADFDPGVFYETTILGVSSGVDITYGFSVINIDRADAPGVSTRERPSVLIEILDPSGGVIVSQSSGAIQPTTDYVTGDWVSVSATFNTTFTQFTVRLSNEAPGGLGNDLAIDDIFVRQTLCDLDGDGVEDSVDLDNDDDGIPNVVELLLSDSDKDGTVNNDVGAYAWVDVNNNGLIDLYDPQDAARRNPGDIGFTGSLGTPIDLTNPIYDTDGDGIVDYLDLDSDNDGVFDVVEYDNRGDVDINGDGNGDGSDKQVLDSSDNPIDNDDFDGDGILSLADNNDDDADDLDHGTANAYPTPLDDDGDGIPNYRDVDSADNPNDFSNGSDIDNTQVYAHLDANNDGIIDDTVDTDGDGILDIFDTDNTVFGSPRDLDDSYTLFFDGRNDYVEDGNVLASGSASIMGWIRSEGVNTSSTNRIALGQDEFYLQVNHSDNTVSLVLNGSTVLTSATVVTDGIWIHLAATTSVSETVLYINGEEEGTIGSGGMVADASSFTIGRLADTDSNYFHGEIDEVRVFNTALTEDELQKMVYQELDDTNSFDSGKIIPLDINTTVGGALERYYKMDAFSNDITEDKTTASTTAKLYNIKDVYFQTAPLPYESIIDGAWGTKATWLHGDVWDIDDEANNKDWSIVHIKNDITTSSRHSTLGLIVDASNKLEVNGDSELKNTWYLNLDGKIDLQDESQLVQTQNSILIATGELERDQQGTENLHTYNYWSSPVHTVNPNADIDGDETYTVGGILSNGADPNNLEPITFLGGANYDGDSTASPIEIADYWIWKFDNRATGDYNLWQHVRSTNTLLVGEGYTMKGPGTGAVTSDWNYAFTGTPNNGEINLYVDAGNAYLVGNPYPSAIDGAEFLSDNTHLNGTLYFWEHYGGGSHILKEYQGGYGMYNYSGGIPALDGTLATPDPDVNQTGGGTKTPKRYIPVGQGFFVDAISGANIKFENDQRTFVTEAGGTNSVFFKNASTKKVKTTSLEDLRPKIRLGYTSPLGYKRQLLVTADENASMDYDWGYEGALIEENLEDMYWKLEGENYIIQGINDIDPSSTILPIGVKTHQEGVVEIAIDSLENVPDNLEIYIKDKDNDLYHDLRESKFLGNASEGTIDDRFEIVFSNESQLSNTEFELDKETSLYFDKSSSNLVIINPKNHQIETLQLINTLGQIIKTTKIDKSDNLIEVHTNLATGVYIAKISSLGFQISKKIIITNN